MNSLACEDKDFHWYTIYKWYSILTLEENNSKKVWVLGIMKEGCMLKAFDFIELVALCMKMFDSRHRFIHMEDVGKTPVPLTPTTFRQMLWLLEQTKVLILLVEDSFLNAQGREVILLQNFLLQPSVGP